MKSESNERKSGACILKPSHKRIVTGLIRLCDPDYWQSHGSECLIRDLDAPDVVDALVIDAGYDRGGWVRVVPPSREALIANRPADNARYTFHTIEDEITFVAALEAAATPSKPIDYSTIRSAVGRVTGLVPGNDWVRRFLVRHGFHRSFVLSARERAYCARKKRARAMNCSATPVDEAEVAEVLAQLAADSPDDTPREIYRGPPGMFARECLKPLTGEAAAAAAQRREAAQASMPESFHMTPEAVRGSRRRNLTYLPDWRRCIAVAVHDNGYQGAIPDVVADDALLQRLVAWWPLFLRNDTQAAENADGLLATAAGLTDGFTTLPAEMKAALLSDGGCGAWPTIAAFMGGDWTPELVEITSAVMFEVPRHPSGGWDAECLIGGFPRFLHDGLGGREFGLMRLGLLLRDLPSLVALLSGKMTPEHWHNIRQALTPALYATALQTVLSRPEPALEQTRTKLRRRRSAPTPAAAGAGVRPEPEPAVRIMRPTETAARPRAERENPPADFQSPAPSPRRRSQPELATAAMPQP